MTLRNFPTLCIDDFYKNPDEIREFALKQDFCIDQYNWPGRRTKMLSEINSDFFNMFCEKLLSIFYEFDSYTEWNIYTSFQIVQPFSNDEQSYKNYGFIHTDSELFSGIIYLTPNINKNCGTSIFKIKDKNFSQEENTYFKKNFYESNIDTGLEDYIKKERGQFDESATFYNYYNRLVAFDSSQYHGVNSFFTTGEPRLTQVFFINSINYKHCPLQRSDKRVLI